MDDDPPPIEPLTQENYKRLPAVEREIADALILEPEALVKRVRQREETAPDFLSAETLVYFIRQTIRNGDTGMRELLFRELFERCSLYFRGQFRGFGQEDRKDLQSEVMNRVVKDLFAQDDSGDYMQVRFWDYLKKKCIDACRKARRRIDATESLDVSYLGNGVFEGRTQLETVVDPRLSPEKFAMISEGLAKLPQHLRDVFLMRHYFDMQIGPDDSAEAARDELTIAAHFGCTGRTIRNRLKKAYRLLDGFFMEKHNGE